MRKRREPIIAQNELPSYFIILVVAVCVAPFALQLLGIDFASNLSLTGSALSSSEQKIFRLFSGAFTHTIFEWAAFSLALLTCLLALSSYAVSRDPVVYIIGVALFCAGSMDAFHALAGARLLTASASNQDLLPLTWALSRTVNALVCLVGVTLFSLAKKNSAQTSLRFVVVVSLSFLAIAYFTIDFCANSPSLPQTQFSNAPISRPLDLIPLFLYLMTSLILFKHYQRRPTDFSFALLLSMVPHIMTQIHAAFGSSELYDHHFNIAHFLKIIAYLVPFSALCYDYVHSHKRMRKAQLDAENASKAKSEFLANISHEIRTPMNAIMGMGEMLSETKLDKSQVTYVSTLKKSGENLLNLINAVLDYSKIEANQIELDEKPISLEEIIDEVGEIMAFLAHSSHVELTCRIDPELPQKYIGDALRIRQILLNLVNNALKFTPTGGYVILEVTESAGQFRRVDFSVRDTGIGIPKSRRKEIFESFTQAHSTTAADYGGTGLGLSICSRLVNLMGGSISLESIEGTGSVFSFSLPLKPSSEATEHKCNFEAMDMTDQNILVVDDRAVNRQIICESLSKSGANLEQASTGVQALELLKEAKSINRPYDILFLDDDMPAMNGYDLIEKLKAELQSNIPAIVMLTSDSGSLQIKNYLALDIGTYVVKPIKRKELCKSILESQYTPESTQFSLLESKSETISLSSERNLKILIVDDNTENRQVIKSYLQNENYALDEASNAKQAIQMVKTKTSYNLVLMDVRMQGMDGLEATKIIRQWEFTNQQEPVPILAVTANAMEEDIAAALEAGCNAHLAKPLRKKVLFDAIKTHLMEFNSIANLPLISDASTDFSMQEIIGFLPEFKVNRLKDLASLNQALSNSDFESIRLLGHTLAGVAPSYGFELFGQLGRQMEVAGKNKDITEVKRLVNDFENLVKRLDEIKVA